MLMVKALRTERDEAVLEYLVDALRKMRKPRTEVFMALLDLVGEGNKAAAQVLSPK
jgi:hypothetical protein